MIESAWERLSRQLGPCHCLAPVAVVVEEATKVLEDAGGKPGHIFNLGHGVLPETDPGVLARVVETVHNWRPGTRSGETAG